MNCPNCAAVMVTARATAFGSEYFYCRVCKKELSEMITLEARVPEASSDAFNNPKWGTGVTFRPGINVIGYPVPNTKSYPCNDPDCTICFPAPSDTVDMKVKYDFYWGANNYPSDLKNS